MQSFRFSEKDGLEAQVAKAGADQKDEEVSVAMLGIAWSLERDVVWKVLVWACMAPSSCLLDVSPPGSGDVELRRALRSSDLRFIDNAEEWL